MPHIGWENMSKTAKPFPDSLIPQAWTGLIISAFSVHSVNPSLHAITSTAVNMTLDLRENLPGTYRVTPTLSSRWTETECSINLPVPSVYQVLLLILVKHSKKLFLFFPELYICNSQNLISRLSSRWCSGILHYTPALRIWTVFVSIL